MDYLQALTQPRTLKINDPAVVAGWYQGVRKAYGAPFAFTMYKLGSTIDCYYYHGGVCSHETAPSVKGSFTGHVVGYRDDAEFHVVAIVDGSGRPDAATPAAMCARAAALGLRGAVFESFEAGDLTRLDTHLRGHSCVLLVPENSGVTVHVAAGGRVAPVILSGPLIEATSPALESITREDVERITPADVEIPTSTTPKKKSKKSVDPTRSEAAKKAHADRKARVSAAAEAATTAADPPGEEVKPAPPSELEAPANSAPENKLAEQIQEDISLAPIAFLTGAFSRPAGLYSGQLRTLGFNPVMASCGCRVLPPDVALVVYPTKGQRTPLVDQADAAAIPTITSIGLHEKCRAAKIRRGG